MATEKRLISLDEAMKATLKNEMEAKEDGTIDESESEPSFAK